EGYASGTLFEDNESIVRGRVSGPLGDNVRASLTASKAEFDGHIRNVFNNRDVNGYDRFAIRGMLEFDATDNISGLLTYEHYEADDDCCADLEALPSGRNPASVAAPDSDGIVDGVADIDLDQRLIDHDFETKTLDESDSWSAEFNVDLFDGFTLTAITGYRDWVNTEFREGDFTSIGGSFDEPVFGVPFQLHDVGTRDYTQVTQEIRLASPADQRLTYMLGGYYFNLDGEADFTRFASCQNNGGQNEAILEANPGLECNSNDIVSATGFAETGVTNYAVFGNGAFEVLPGLDALFGFRYADDRVSFTYTRRNNDEFGRQGVGVRPALPNGQFPEITGGFNNTFTNSSDNTNFAVRAGIQSDLGELFGDGMNLGSAYFTYSQGYKGPGFNVFYNMGTNDALPIDEETSDAFEVGYKFQTDTLLVSAALYRTEIEGFQANNFDNSTGVTITRLTNAGDVSTQGIELDAQWTPLDNLTFTGSIALNEAEIDRFNCPVDPTTGEPPANCTDRSGLDLLFSPDFNYTFGAQYIHPLPGLGRELIIDGTFAHVDEQQSLLPGTDGTFDPVGLLPDYNLLDVSATLSFADGRYSVSLLGKNLLDESFVTTYSGDGFRYQIPREADRRFGISLRGEF
ncbi:MAG: TonB-dependent receptor, partial [Caulobacterales bacterium]|nr:TonB-dependent receptor [Caulobacterales bacterium]